MNATICEEGVTRDGEFQPCEKPAVAWRRDPETRQPYPVCKRHTRGNVLTLDHMRANQTCHPAEVAAWEAEHRRLTAAPAVPAEAGEANEQFTAFLKRALANPDTRAAYVERRVNDFIREWCKKRYVAHLLDDDDNAGERLRRDLLAAVSPVPAEAGEALTAYFLHEPYRLADVLCGIEHQDVRVNMTGFGGIPGEKFYASCATHKAEARLVFEALLPMLLAVLPEQGVTR